MLSGGAIDETGLGANLAEDLRKHNSKWAGVTFNYITKAQLATDIRKVFQEQVVIIPPDRDLQRDLHSVQRVVTAANNVVYEAARTEEDEGRSHADRFWSLALAIHALVRLKRTWKVSVIQTAPAMPDVLRQVAPAGDQTFKPDKRGNEVLYDQAGTPVTRRELRKLRR